MNTITTVRNGNSDLISPSWALDAVRAVRDALQSLSLDRLADGRDDLALKLSEAIGGLSVSPRTLDDAGPDFEDVADPAEWAARVDDSTWTTEPTPLALLSMGLHPIAGGSPEFVPSEADWADYSEAFLDRLTFDDHVAEIAEGYEIGSDRLSEADVIRMTGCC